MRTSLLQADFLRQPAAGEKCGTLRRLVCFGLLGRFDGGARVVFGAIEEQEQGNGGQR